MSELTPSSIATLALDNFFRSLKNVESRTFRLARQQVPADMLKPALYDTSDAPSHMFAEPKSRPPPQPLGSLHLQASVGEYLGHGHSSTVFALENVHLSDAPTDAQVPELVVKIARINRVTSLIRETWYYDEMQILQGVALPRCYGYFETTLSADADEKELLHRLFKKFPAEVDGEHNAALNRDTLIGPLHPVLEERRTRRDILAVLVMERLGSRLPIGLPVPEETRQDIMGLYEEIGYFCVDNSRDVRVQNILRAPSSPPGLPSVPSPFTQRVHNWRMIDFEFAVQTNLSNFTLDYRYYVQVKGMFRDIEEDTEEEYENLIEDEDGGEDWYDSGDDEGDDDSSSD